MKIKDYCPAEFQARLATDDDEAAAVWMCCRVLARNMPMATVTSTGKANLSCTSSSLYLNTSARVREPDTFGEASFKVEGANVPPRNQNSFMEQCKTV
jgi:hypothetical protein